MNDINDAFDKKISADMAKELTPEFVRLVNKLKKMHLAFVSDTGCVSNFANLMFRLAEAFGDKKLSVWTFASTHLEENKDYVEIIKNAKYERLEKMIEKLGGSKCLENPKKVD